MKVIAFCNEKGGVGKSTLACHLGWFLAKQDKRTLLIDLDGQQNITQTFLSTRFTQDNDSGVFTSYDLFEEERTIDVIKVSKYIDIIPSHSDLSSVELFDRSCMFLPKKHTKKLAQYYDYVVIDTPPALGMRLMSAIIACDYVVVPFCLDDYSMMGAIDFLATLDIMRDSLNLEFINLGLLPNRVNPLSSNHKDKLQEILEQKDYPVISRPIFSRIHFEKAIEKCAPVWENCKNKGDYAAKAEALALNQYILDKIASLS